MLTAACFFVPPRRAGRTFPSWLGRPRRVVLGGPAGASAPADLVPPWHRARSFVTSFAMDDRPLTHPRRTVVRLASLGLLLSCALELVHVRTYVWPAAQSYCSATSHLDCAAVAGATSSVFLGLPWAAWGIFGFLALLIAGVRRSAWLLPLSTVAAVTSAILLGVSVLAIRRICLLCEAVHLVSFALAWTAWKYRAALQADLADRASWTRIILLPTVLALSAALAIPRYWNAFSYRSAPLLPTGLTEDGHPYIGAQEPKQVVHEFTDYFCPHCKVASTLSLTLLGKHADVRLVRHDTPRTPCHPESAGCAASRASICAAEQDKFWQADRWLFAFAEANEPIDLDRMAKDLSLDRERLGVCFEAPDTFARADERYRHAQKKGVKFVPSYLIDGKRFDSSELRSRLGK